MSDDRRGPRHDRRFPPDGAEPFVHAVMITFRRPDVARSTVESLELQTRPPDHIWIIDNDRSDLGDLAGGRDDVTYLRTGANLGPAGGIAFAMEQVLAIARDGDLLLLVDDDDPPPYADSLEGLVRLFGRFGPDDRVAGVGLSGSRFDRRRGRVRRLTDAELDGIIDVDSVAGNQMPLYRVGAIRASGPFDAQLFFGFEELDFGLRLHRAGYRLVVDASTIRRQRTDRGRLGLGRRVPGRHLIPWRRYYSARNIVVITRRNGGWTGMVVAFVLVGLGGSLRALALRQPRAAASTIRGALDGLFGRLGMTVDPTR